MDIKFSLLQAAFRWSFQNAFRSEKANRSEDVHLEVTSDHMFWAQLEKRANHFRLRVSSSMLTNTLEFWENLATTKHSPAKGQPLSSASRSMHLLSLSWFVLHELSHINLGHFKLRNQFGVVHRKSEDFDSPELLPTAFRGNVIACLEMQADHEATETLLGVYSSNNWQELREKVLAISGMMILIEIEDTRNGAEGRTYPKAATRIFQLLGHLSEMPLIKAQLNKDPSFILDENEVQSFVREVTIPSFLDAFQLAQAAGATHIESDLGSPENFFKDMEIAKLGKPSHYADLKTQGAQEWAKLWPCNEALKPILGGHFMT